MLTWFNNTKVIHIEPTDVCQASCPLCGRETDLQFDKSLKHHLSVDQIKNLVPVAGIEQLDKMFMCGNYGDPAAGKHTLEIYQYFRELNPKITLGMNTNGAIQNSNWWADIGNLFNKEQDYVVFSIDGLDDTNHIYRRGVDWNKLIENAKAFINAGGNAHWDMLVYQHNEHQVNDCKNLAQELGFSWFRAKISKRNSTINWLRPPATWKSPNLTETNQIKCFAEYEKSIYISAKGIIHPCCWLGYSDGVPLENFNKIKSSWNTKHCNITCKKTCGITLNETPFIDQWQQTIQLK